MANLRAPPLSFPASDLDSYKGGYDARLRAIREPSDDTKVWKYLDLAKYLALLKTRHLHLAPTTEFWDRYEGDIGVAQKKALVEKYGRERYEHVMSLFQSLRDRTYVSCWTENEFESDAMWRIYTGANYGVALQSSYGRLKAVLPHASPGLLRYCGRVNYVDFKTDLLDLNAYCLPYFYKRKSFEHEREVRVLVQDLREIERETNVEKIPLSVEQLNSLIESVHLSPGAPLWFRDLVQDISRDYGLDRRPIPSSLDEEPA